VSNTEAGDEEIPVALAFPARSRMRVAAGTRLSHF
jgi:hypothetical protein